MGIVLKLLSFYTSLRHVEKIKGSSLCACQPEIESRPHDGH